MGFPSMQYQTTASGKHYNDVIMSAMASQNISLTRVCSTVYSDADQRKHQSSMPLAFVGGIHRWPVNSPHKGPVTRKMSQFDDVITKSNTFCRWYFETHFPERKLLYWHSMPLEFVPKCPIAINRHWFRQWLDDHDQTTMTKQSWHCIGTSLDNSKELWMGKNPSSGLRNM